MVSLISGRGHFTLLYKHTTYTTESGRKENKQARTWVSPKHKKGEVFGTFLAFYASVSVTRVHSNKIPIQLLGTLTHPLALADPSSGSAGPSSSLNSHLSLTVAFLQLLLTALGPCFPRLLLVSLEISRASPLWGFRAKTYKGILWLALIHTHTHRNECPNRATIFDLCQILFFSNIYIYIYIYIYVYMYVCVWI